jgi:hypothetical protein
MNEFASHPPDRNGDLLITKNIRRLQTLHSLHTEVPNINNLGNRLSLEQQLKAIQIDGLLAPFWHGLRVAGKDRFA